MKKNLFLVAAVALAAVVSCNKEGLGDNDGAQTPSSVVFTAGVETKTTLVVNGNKTYSINWISGDAISVDGVTFTTTDSGAKAFFLTEDAFTEDNDYEAIYPATAGSSFASVTVPESQEATAGNFCSSAAVSVAKSTTTSLDFKNLTSFLKFQVPADANTVTISSIDDLAGEVTVNYNNGEPTWTAKNTVKTIKVTCSGGFKKGKDYYVSVLPGVKKNFEVRIDGYLSKNKESVEPKRSTVMKMGVLPEPVQNGYLQGSFNSWSVGQPLYDDLNGWTVLKNFKISANNTEVKFEKSGTWTGYDGSFYLNCYAKATSGKGGNIKINKGTYDFYYHSQSSAIYVTEAGALAPGVKRPVRLLVNNSANKTNLRVYMWNNSDQPIIGDWNNRPYMTNKVTLNGTTYTYYELGEEYFGQTLNYKLTWNGGESQDVKGVSFGCDAYYDLW